MTFIDRLWYQRHWLSSLLWPLSWVYRVVIFLRRLLYRCHLKKSTRFPVHHKHHNNQANR